MIDIFSFFCYNKYTKRLGGILMTIKEVMFWIYLVSIIVVVSSLSILVSQGLMKLESLMYFLIPFLGVTINSFVKEMKEN